jgi:hypothetical protein
MKYLLVDGGDGVRHAPPEVQHAEANVGQHNEPDEQV